MSPEHFLIAGAQRSGTTLLYSLLDQHPEIEMAHPLRPEPKYFLRADVAPADLNAYRRTFFARKPGARVHGEKSTTYFERHDVAERILRVLPDVKVVFVLRDPVERALSNYRFSVESGAETESLEHAILHERDRRDSYDRMRFSVSPFAYLARGHYDRFLQHWESALGRRRMFLLLFERLVRSNDSARPLFEWLGVDPSFEPVYPPSPINATEAVVQPSTDLRRQLIEHFRESNRRVAERYGLDLSLWQS